MTRFLGVLLYLTFSLLSLSVEAQIPFLRQYTVSEGLPTNEVFYVYQDYKGCVWLATAYGVCWFDGRHFFSAENPKEFRNSSILEIKEDHKKQLWFVSLKGNLYYQKSDRVIPFVYNSEIQDKLNTNKGHIKNSFLPFSDSSAVISFKERGAVIVGRNGIVSYKYPNQRNLVLVDYSKGNPFISFHYQNSITESNVAVLDSKKPPLVVRLGLAPTHLYAIRLKNGNKVFSLDRIVYVVGDGWVKKYEMENAVTGIYEDRDSHIWLSVNGHGAYCYSKENFTEKPLLRILEKEVVTSILQDRENSFWFSTLNSGVFFAPSLSFLNYTTKSGLLSDKITKVTSTGDDVWVGYADGFVSKISENGSIKHFASKGSNSFSVKDLCFFKDDNTVWVCSDILYLIKNSNVNPVEKRLVAGNKNPNYALLPRALEKSRDGGVWIASNRGFKKVKDGKVVYDSHETGDFSGVVYSLDEENNGDLWIASNALFLYSKGKVRQIAEKNPLLNTSIIKGKINEFDNRFWFGTKSNGVIVFTGKKFVQIKGLQSNNVSSFDFRKNQVWVGTNCGVDCITIDQVEPIRYRIKHYNTSHGLISDDVKDICISGDRVFLATFSGLSCFDISKDVDNKVAPAVRISSMRVNDKDMNFHRLLMLNHDQNFIDISFNAFTYKRKGDVRYRYKVEGLSDKWFYTTEETIRLYKLPPGDYRLTIAAENNDRVWSNNPASVRFSIAKPFWSTYWFNGLCLIVIALIAFAIFRTRLRIVQKISMHEQKENLWKNQSLSLQMNPHFIFNTLNSIQLYILKCDVDSSLHYLSKFSSLMRKTLENSSKMNITLKEELESLELYLELESLRCEGKFLYRIECDPSISLADSYIPTLLIQPYVENSIWHGIMPKASSGHILIRIQNVGAFIKCSITDDGIGRVKSQEIQRMSLVRRHKSFATKITSSRIEILKSLYSKDFSLEYVDKYDNDGNALGTEVILIFPRDYITVRHVTQIVE